jgi:hypothetical protein
VETIRTALRAIEWPDDELSVFATLRGSLFAIGDEELLEYRHRFRRLHPFRVPDDAPASVAAIPEALELLASLHRRRNHRPIAETINLLLETTRAHAGFALRPSGEQALANVLHVAEQARSYESSGGISFRGFIERLLEDADARKAAEAPILEEGSDGVRIMTVHRAKGLEFPVVVLADMTAGIARGQASRFIDPARNLCAVRIAGWSPTELREHQEDEVMRDTAEGVRVAYVAATRARDLLVVPALGDGPQGGVEKNGVNASWISPLDGAIYPRPQDWARSRPAAGCPRFGRDSVLERPPDFESDLGSVRPGGHELGDPPYGVAWWDPRALELGAPPLFGVRRVELMSKEADPADVRADAKKHRDWETRRSDVIARASLPSISVQTATERARQEIAPTPPVEIVELERDPGRPAGPRFGALVHAILATVPLPARWGTSSSIPSWRRLESRRRAASVGERLR